MRENIHPYILYRDMSVGNMHPCMGNTYHYNTGMHAADAYRHYRASYFKMDQLIVGYKAIHNHVCTHIRCPVFPHAYGIII